MSADPNGVDDSNQSDEDEILSLREAIRLNTQTLRYLRSSVDDLRIAINKDNSKKIPLWTHVLTMIATVLIMAGAQVVMFAQAVGFKHFGIPTAEASNE